MSFHSNLKLRRRQARRYHSGDRESSGRGGILYGRHVRADLGPLGVHVDFGPRRRSALVHPIKNGRVLIDRHQTLSGSHADGSVNLFPNGRALRDQEK
jgi:hypothetical protein